MDSEEEAVFLVDKALSSIDTVMKDWERLDTKTKVRYKARFERLVLWKDRLENWRGNFLQTTQDARPIMLIELHGMLRELS